MKSFVGKKRPRGTYSLGGCETCRRRHIKCDQARPTCQTCRTIGVVCDGSPLKLKWLTVTGSSGPVAPGAEVNSHSHGPGTLQLHTQFDPGIKAVDQSLSELEAKCKDVGSLQGGAAVAVGPFGVFGVQQHGVQKHDTIPATQPVASPPMEPYQTSIDDDLNDFGQNTDCDPFIGQGNVLGWPDLFEMETPFSWLSPQAIDEVLDQTIIASPPPPSLLPTTPAPETAVPNNHSQTSANTQPTETILARTAVSPTQRLAATTTLRPEDAQLLIKHFRDEVLPPMWSMPVGKKRPIDLHVHAAIMTLAELTYMTSLRVSHASVANLLALLAVSAKHLAARLNSNRLGDGKIWDEFAESRIQEAKQNLQYALQHELSPKTAKYKDVLMAIAMMLSFSVRHPEAERETLGGRGVSFLGTSQTLLTKSGFKVLFDRQKEARTYMVDAETLVRTYGLAKRTISRRARLLHHTYTWVRIVGESTYVLRTYDDVDINIATGQLSQLTRQQQQSSSTVKGINSRVSTQDPRLDDFLRLEPSNVPSDGNTGDNNQHAPDIHLETNRGKSESTLMLIYGVSETWLSLLSQTTRLANVTEWLSLGKTQPDLSHPELVERRKRRLENSICSFALRNESSGPATGDERDNQTTGPSLPAPCAHSESNPPSVWMVKALNYALVIFFYRRIMNVNPWILQEHVNHVIHALKNFDSSCERDGVAGPGSPWPAFMAGCEALNPEQRGYISGWFDQSFAATGFTRLQTAKSCMHEVWRRQDQNRLKGTEDVYWTWSSVCKEQDLYILLS